MEHSKSRLTLGILGAALLLGACTVKKQDTPSLTGPSELGTSITITVSPDVLYQDGASQSLVTITARDNNGQLLRNLGLRAEIAVNGIITDFGTLSARNLVTDVNGRATVIYTAPASPAVSIDTGTQVQIQVTPAGTDFGNATARFASIRLVPVGVVTPPSDGLVPKIAVSTASPADHVLVTFDGSGSTATNASIVSYLWKFGDGDTASGIAVQHAYDEGGTFVATLTVTDSIGRVNSATQTMTVSTVTPSAPNITISPDSPIVGQQVFFTSTTTLTSTGRRIVAYDWNFGDGSTGSGQSTSHVYQTEGSYTIVLTITDDQGHQATATRAGFAVATDLPKAKFTFAPASPTAGTSVTFDANTSTAAIGRTIVSYSWSFGDGATGSGATTSHAYAAGSYTVVLTVTDSAGKTSTLSQPLTVSP
jgi:PKD repeat protein